ncbi:MAG: hypothetical protein AAF770_03985, partial [Bacteroidota bacterium]
NSNTAFWQNNPRVVAFRDDDFVIVWNSIGQDGSGLGIFFQRFYPNGTKQSSEMQANNYTNGDQYGATVGAFSDKGMIIAWEGNGQDQGTGNITDSIGIYAQLFDQYNNREGYEFRVNTYTAGTQTKPTVSILPNNQFLITWVSYYQVSPSYASTHAQLFMRNGTRVGKEFQVSSAINGFQLDPHAVAFNNENIFCVFASCGEDGDNYGIVGQAFRLYTLSYSDILTTKITTDPNAALGKKISSYENKRNNKSNQIKNKIEKEALPIIYYTISNPYLLLLLSFSSSVLTTSALVSSYLFFKKKNDQLMDKLKELLLQGQRKQARQLFDELSCPKRKYLCKQWGAVQEKVNNVELNAVVMIKKGENIPTIYQVTRINATRLYKWKNNLPYNLSDENTLNYLKQQEKDEVSDDHHFGFIAIEGSIEEIVADAGVIS